MRSGLYPRLTVVSLALLSVTLVVFGVLNFQQRGRYQHPDDGITWVDSGKGVTAWLIEPDGAGERAGIRKGDRLPAGRLGARDLRAAAGKRELSGVGGYRAAGSRQLGSSRSGDRRAHLPVHRHVHPAATVVGAEIPPLLRVLPGFLRLVHVFLHRQVEPV